MLILYTTEDGKSRIQLRADENTVWLTQLEMADLFATTKQNISLHLQNIFEDGELQEGSVVKESLTTAADGKAYSTKLYNLDAILPDADVAVARVAERVRQGGHHIPEDVIRRRFAAGLRNFEQAYKAAVDAWAKYDNVGESPILLEWGENS